MSASECASATHQAQHVVVISPYNTIGCGVLLDVSRETFCEREGSQPVWSVSRGAAAGSRQRSFASRTLAAASS
ncbi:MAG: hypothetical protein ACK55I_18140 [bacterium]